MPLVISILAALIILAMMQYYKSAPSRQGLIEIQWNVKWNQIRDARREQEYQDQVQMWEDICRESTESGKWEIFRNRFRAFPPVRDDLLILRTIKSAIIFRDPIANHVLECYPGLISRLDIDESYVDQLSEFLTHQKYSGPHHLDHIQPKTARAMLLLITGQDFTSPEAYQEYRRKHPGPIRIQNCVETRASTQPSTSSTDFQSISPATQPSN
jgi:hypothetical protein